MSFTPGPWRVGDAGATVFGPPNGNPSPETIANVRRSENARLIAAAPELLDVLILALPYVESAETDSGYKSGAVARMSSKIRAAIAKAEGR